MGERQLCKLNVVGSIPSTSTKNYWKRMLKGLVTGILLLVCGTAYAAGCTVEEAQAKHQAFMNAAVLFAQKEPAKYQEAARVMQTELPELQKLGDLDKLCGFYEEWTKKMQ